MGKGPFPAPGRDAALAAVQTLREVRRARSTRISPGDRSSFDSALQVLARFVKASPAAPPAAYRDRDYTPATSSTNPYPVVWMKVEAFCELRRENKAAVMSRRRRGIWLDGQHTKVKDGRLYVNVPEADRWVEAGGP